jgi:hypothetical protein
MRVHVEAYMRWVSIISGLLLALTASVLLLIGAIKSGVAIAIGVLGIGLIAISDRWKNRKQP